MAFKVQMKIVNKPQQTLKQFRIQRSNLESKEDREDAELYGSQRICV